MKFPKKCLCLEHLNWDVAYRQWQEGRLSDPQWEAYALAWGRAAYRFTPARGETYYPKLRSLASKGLWQEFWAAVDKVLQAREQGEEIAQ